METPISYVAKAVLARLKAVSLPGLKPEQVAILTDDKPPPNMGEMFVTISIKRLETVGPLSNYRKEFVLFNVNLIQRVRDIPNDRTGTIHVDKNQAHEIHQSVIDAVQSLVMYNNLYTLIKSTQAADATQKMYNIALPFLHRYTMLDPIKLYPGYFYTKPSQPQDKLAGFRTYSVFRSPAFYPVINPLSC